MKKLSKVTVGGTSPTTLLSSGTRLRLVHDNDEIVFIKCPLFRTERMVFRYPVSQLALVRHERATVAPLRWGPIIETMRIWRNTQQYGFFDGMAATNLQTMDARPNETVPVIKIGFFVPGAEYEFQIFMLGERWSSRMPLADCGAYLQDLIFKHKRSRRLSYGI